jgi:hypothetical protein
MMKRSGYKLLPLLLIALFCSPPLFATPGDTLVYRRPMYFTANAGQWDEAIRYAMLGDRTSSWFNDDGIILARPRQSRELPGETPHIPEDGTPMETLHIDFVNPSPDMRIVALDTTRAVAHFYLHPDSTGWYEHVRNHRGIRYENVWEGVDIEYRAGAGPSLQQKILLQPGADASRIALRVTGAEAGEVRRMLHETLSEPERKGGALPKGDTKISGDMVIGPGFRFKDTLHLTTEFNTAFRFQPTAPDYHTSLHGHVVSERGEVTVLGYTESASLPVRNALQGTLRGGSDRFVMRFDSAGKDYAYCTYIGGSGFEQSWPTYWGGGGGGGGHYGYYNHNRLLDCDENGRIYGAVDMTEGAPLLPSSYSDYRGNRSYIFALDPDGTLYASTYLGGPGKYGHHGLMLSERGVHVLGCIWEGDASVTDGALMTQKHCDTCSALHLTCLDFQLSSPIYETYVLSMNHFKSSPSYYNRLHSLFSSHSDGEVTVAISHPRYDYDWDVKLPDGSELAYGNMWVCRIDADGKQLLSSTVITPAEIPPSQSHNLMIDEMLSNPDKELYLSGMGSNISEWQPDSLPSPWRTHLLFESKGLGGPRDRWILRLNADGQIRTGLYLGSTRHAGRLPLIENTTCDGMIMLNYDYPDNSLGHLVPTTILHPYNEVSLQDDGHPHRYVADIDDQLQVRYATNWNTAYHIPAAYGSQYYGLNGTIDRHGYLYLSFHQINPIFIRERLVFHNS